MGTIKEQDRPKPKRTIDEWRRYVTTRAEMENRTQGRPGPKGGSLISGVEMSQANRAIDRLPPAEQKRLKGLMGAFPKYQVLSILVNPRNALLIEHETEILEIVEAVAGLDYEKRQAAARFPGADNI